MHTIIAVDIGGTRIRVASFRRGCLSFISDPLMGAIHRSINRSIMEAIYIKDLTITRASLGENAGLMGAVVLGHLPPDG